MRVALLLNCQAPLWRDSLLALSPEIVITRSDHVGASADLATAVAAARDDGAEVIIQVAELGDQVTDELERIGWQPASLVRVPGILFGGFHPDIGYVFDANGQMVRNAWNTDWVPRIAATGFAAGLSVGQVLGLYTEECFTALGYLDYWGPASDALIYRFDETGFDFRSWMQHVKRRGVFMHGINHPKPVAIAALAEQVCRDRLGIQTRGVDAVEPTLFDALGSSVIWPLHAPIAARLGLPAFEAVKISGEYVLWQRFVEECFRAWEGRFDESMSMIPSFMPSQIETVTTLGRGIAR